MYIYIQKTMNNGYGDTMKGFKEVHINKETLQRIWSGREDQSIIDELMELTNFDWNVLSREDGESNWKELIEKGIVSDEFEECICCVGINREQILETILKMI